MAAETEIKIRLGSKDRVTALLARCSKLYGPGSERFQRDEYFDTEDELLKTKDFTVRLRVVDAKAKIALKGPRKFFENSIHSRLELEFSAIEEEARDEIARQQLSPTTIVEKRRWEFSREELHIAVDTLPFIGSFLEIEASTPTRITKVLAVLQIDSCDAVNENYTELLERRLSDIGLPIRPNLDATFEAERQFLAARMQ